MISWHRFYDPTTGRYITPDPIGFGGGDVNLYVYVGGNPVNRIDPEGLESPINGNWISIDDIEKLSECMRLCILDKILNIPSPYWRDLDLLSKMYGYTDNWTSGGEEDYVDSYTGANELATRRWKKHAYKAARRLAKLNMFLAYIAGFIDFSADLKECECRCENQ